MPAELTMIWFIIVLLIVLSSLKANKKAQQQKNGQGAQAAQASKNAQAAQAAKAKQAQAKKAKAEKKYTFAQAMAELQAALNEQKADKPAAPVAQARAVPKKTPSQGISSQGISSQGISSQGASMLDEEGCVGGSMEHTHTEGESRAEHGRHLADVQRREAEESLAAQAAMELNAMNLQRLRRAVVMAEILGRPRALRKGIRS